MKMKKKVLSVAVLAALGAGAAQAVNVSEDGTGQVILFPYYTVQGNEETYLQVTNTTGMGKAVKIRFREAANSNEVLDFNIYLSPYDVWTGTITDAGEGAGIRTDDTSCTVPYLGSTPEPFRTYKMPDGATAKDTKEGYVEIIEMGSIAVDNPHSVVDHDGDGHADFEHIDGVPENCDTFLNNWKSAGTWATSGGAVGLLPPSGGLFGALSIINANSGSQVGVNATSLEAVYDRVNHYDPGNDLPTLELASPAISVILANDGLGNAAQLYVDDWTPSGVRAAANAVSATLTAASVMNGYSVNVDNYAASAWVITFPTRWMYSDQLNSNQAPFSAPFTSTGCEDVSLTLYDREEHSVTNEDIDFSPRPVVPGKALCNEVNVLQFGESHVFSSDLTTFKIPENDLPGNKGWLNMTFSGSQVLSGNANGNYYEGLPVIGFKAKVLGNGALPRAGSYGSAVNHVYNRVISGANGTPGVPAYSTAAPSS